MNILLEAGAAIDVKNNMGKTPAMEAASNSHFNIMQLLKDFDQAKGEIDVPIYALEIMI